MVFKQEKIPEVLGHVQLASGSLLAFYSLEELSEIRKEHAGDIVSVIERKKEK